MPVEHLATGAAKAASPSENLLRPSALVRSSCDGSSRPPPASGAPWVGDRRTRPRAGRYVQRRRERRTPVDDPTYTRGRCPCPCPCPCASTSTPPASA